MRMINKTKRMMLPRTIKIPRKEYFWGVTARAGAHRKQEAVPLLIVLRDYLHLGDKEREITRTLSNGMVTVDSRTVKEKGYSLGFMDIVSLKDQEKYYRIIYSRKGILSVGAEDAAMKDYKLLKIKGKHVVSGKRMQFSFHDGTNRFLDNNDLRTGDVLKINLNDRSIVATYKFAKGSKVYLTGGTHIGEIATIREIEIKSSSRANMVHFEEGFSSLAEYAFVIGSGTDVYRIPEVIAP